MSDSPSDERSSLRRRRLLAGAGAALLGAAAGCASLGGASEPEEPDIDRLTELAVYRADGVELAFPEGVNTVDEPEEAYVVVLPGDTDVGPEQAAEWFTAGRVVALIGDGAEPTYLDWRRSDTFGEAFENGGLGDASPDPQLLAAESVDRFLYRYGRTWEGGPSETQLLEGLDEILVEMESRTPS